MGGTRSPRSASGRRFEPGTPRSAQVEVEANASPRRVGCRATARDRRLATRLLSDLESICLQEAFLHLKVNDIAERRRCSKSTVYHLAPTQWELFELVAKRFLKGIRVRGRFAAEQAGDWAAEGVPGSKRSGASPESSLAMTVKEKK
jgi:AcrR family transcriptional regulator